MSKFWDIVSIVWAVSYLVFVIDSVIRLTRLYSARKEILLSKWVENAIKALFYAPMVALLIVSVWILDYADFIDSRFNEREKKR